MNETKFTPGPWKVGASWDSMTAIYDDNSIFIAQADTGIGRDWILQNPLGKERAKANAHLIAAAPDFYSEANAMIERHDAEARKADFDSCGCEDCRPFRAIVKKARGEQA